MEELRLAKERADEGSRSKSEFLARRATNPHADERHSRRERALAQHAAQQPAARLCANGRRVRDGAARDHQTISRRLEARAGKVELEASIRSRQAVESAVMLLAPKAREKALELGISSSRRCAAPAAATRPLRQII